VSSAQEGRRAWQGHSRAARAELIPGQDIQVGMQPPPDSPGCDLLSCLNPGLGRIAVHVVSSEQPHPAGDGRDPDLAAVLIVAHPEHDHCLRPQHADPAAQRPSPAGPAIGAQNERIGATPTGKGRL
jgi:hypothetical protein